jgi:hypothetical protein
MIRVLIISAVMIAAVPCYAQDVRVFNGPLEHIYGPGGRLLDSPELRAKNEQIWRRSNPEQWRDAQAQWNGADPSGQSGSTIGAGRRQTPRSWWAEVPQQPSLSAWGATCDAWTNC